MKFLKISLIALAIGGSLSSCLKAKNDFAGIREDEGSIVTSIAETQYINTDAQNIGFHFQAFSNFSFTQLPNEQVKFFTLHIGQPRKKMSGPMTVKVSMTALAGYTLPPAGAITIPSEISVPASDASSYDFTVKFAVNKTLLDPNDWYGATFTITSVSQGVFSALDKSVEVIFNGWPDWNPSKVTGRYVATTTITDAANVYRVNDNTRYFMLTEGDYATGAYVPNVIYPSDLYIYAFGSATFTSLYANNLSTGANVAIFNPVYRVDATGKVIDVLNRSTLVSLNPVFDASAPNSFVYTSNDERVLSVKYSVSLTLNSVTRLFTVTDKYVYDKIQAYY